MGHQNRLNMRRLDRAEQLLQALAGKIQAVAESAGSALAVEALCEIVGREEVGKVMRDLMKKKQVEAEAAMAARVATEVEAGRLTPIDAVDEKSVVVGQRTEGEATYRVDLVTPAMPKEERTPYLGKKVGDVVEQGKVRTEIREIYGPGKEKPAASAVATPLEESPGPSTLTEAREAVEAATGAEAS